MTLDEKKTRYQELLHAMQSGVAFWMEYDPVEVAPKHLRVGINSALVSASATALALFRKGVLTEDEYFDALIELTEADVASYAEKVSARCGRSVSLA